MKLFMQDEKHVSACWVTGRPHRDDWRATLIVKAAYRLALGGVASPDARGPVVARGDDIPDKQSAPRYASDFVLFKPQADLLVCGHAHAPAGHPVARCRVSVALDHKVKSLAVIGDRYWGTGPLGAKPSEPVPFVKMRLGYERAFGGADRSSNPVGRGAAAGPGEPLPNIEHLDDLILHPTDRPQPAGFGPIDATWKPRAGKLGSFNESWRKQHWPWYPPDLDWSFFNAAPADQQFPYFRGDETLAFENMHPDHPIYRTQLPGAGARVFVERCKNAVFEEVPVKLDTVWINVEEETLVLLWRGTTRVASPRLRDVASIYATLEKLDARTGIEAHHGAFVRLRDGPAQAAEAEAHARRAAITAQGAAADAKMAEARKQVLAGRQTAQALMTSTGLGARREKLTKTQDLMAQLENAVAALKAHDPARGQQLQDRLEDIDRKIGDALGKVQRPESWTTERVIETMAQGGSLAKARLDGLNLDDLDLSGADLRGATLKNATLRKTRLFRANLSGADLEKTDLTGARFVEADLTRANVADAIAGGASFAGAAVEGAIFTKLAGNAADFSGAHGASADFTEATLNRARFLKANLPRASFSAAHIACADFSEASLPSADFAGAHAQFAIMAGADITNLRASRCADFSDGRFTGASAARSVWQQAKLDRADFSRATLTHAQFPEAALTHAVFDRARLDGASFDDAVMTGARLTRAHMLRASFERADLTDAIIEGANLYGAGLLDAKLAHTRFQGSFIAQTVLAAP